MRKQIPICTVVFLSLLLGRGGERLLIGGEGTPEEGGFFEKQIRPLLVAHCFECHGEDKREGGLRLTSRTALLEGGDSGPVVQLEEKEKSLLLQAVRYLDDLQMPPNGKLSEGEIELLKRWVEMGVPWGEQSEPVPVTDEVSQEFQARPEHRKWWAFQPIQSPVVPMVKKNDWALNEIDFFIGTELETQGMEPSPVADRRTWLRRVTFDLTGLPPTHEDFESFLSDDSPDAYEKVVEQLLGSPAYGERWGRHWLDVVRYADYHDGDAKARDATCEPLNAWRYRDWVVEAFNRDLPFDQFVFHQIAGDLLPPPEGKDYYAEGLIATTFLTNGAWDRGDADKEKMVSDMVDDNIDTIGKAFLGLTLGCARCHDHKFDPISQADYYGLAGIFYSTHLLKELGAKGGNYTLNRVPLADKAYVTQREEQLTKLKQIEGELAELDKKDPKPPVDDPKRVELGSARDRLKAELLPEPPLAEAASEGGMPGGLFPGIQDVPIHVRGSYNRLGKVVPRRMPEFFAGKNQSPVSTGSGRREMAEWVTSRSNPLTARVIVNRVWQWHFGAGIVRTPNNFGMLSEQPSHPGLLDWLATRLMEENWSLKQLQRRIVLSATYRQSGKGRSENETKDPENRWVGRFSGRRLDAEEIRDAMLTVGGRLTGQAGGPADDQLSGSRRSLYLQTARWDRGSFATLFDAANPDASVESRGVSTVAPQALFLMNHPFTHEVSLNLAERLLKEIPQEQPDCDRLRIGRAYQLLYGRNPSEVEVEIAQGILQGTDEATGWKDLSHVLLCSNEFVYVD